MKIKVGYQDWTVRPMSASLKATQWAAEACCVSEDQTIHLRPESTPSRQAAGLIHEVIHACFSSFGLPREGLCEEDVASRLDAPLANVIRDNPKLFEVLHKALTEGKPIVK